MNMRRMSFTVVLIAIAALGLSTACAAPTPTPVPPTATPLPTATRVPPTATLVPPTATTVPPTPTPDRGDAQRGQYMYTLLGGCSCHTSQAGVLAGGTKFEGAFGVVYSRNLTSDPATGIAKYTDQQIMDAIRLGKRPADGAQLWTTMPYANFSAIADRDVKDLVAFLRAASPISNTIPARDLKVPVPAFTPRQPAPAAAPASGAARGEYLVNTISRCGNCHTTRNADGSQDPSRFLGGRFDTRQGVISNITPDEETGIGKWTQPQIATLLRTGVRPDGSKVSSTMETQVNETLKNLTEADALAIAAYLKTLTPVKNKVVKP